MIPSLYIIEYIPTRTKRKETSMIQLIHGDTPVEQRHKVLEILRTKLVEFNDAIEWYRISNVTKEDAFSLIHGNLLSPKKSNLIFSGLSHVFTYDRHICKYIETRYTNPNINILNSILDNKELKLIIVDSMDKKEWETDKECMKKYYNIENINIIPIIASILSDIDSLFFSLINDGNIEYGILLPDTASISMIYDVMRASALKLNVSVFQKNCSGEIFSITMNDRSSITYKRLLLR